MTRVTVGWHVVAHEGHGSPVFMALWPGSAGLRLGPGPAVVVVMVSFQWLLTE